MVIFLTTLEQWFWHMWDHLWRLLLWNLVLFGLTLPLLTAQTEAGMVIALVWFVIVFGPLLTGTISWCWAMADDRSPDLRELLRRLGRCYPRALALHFLFALAIGIITFGIQFYIGPRGQEMFGQVFGLALGGFALWIGIFLTAWWMWAQVALAEDRGEGDPRGLFAALRQGGKILLVHPFLTLMHVGILAAAFLMSVRTFVPLLLFWHTWTALYLATAVYEMYVAAETKAEMARRAEEEGAKRPTSWKEIMADEAPGGSAAAYRGRRPRRSLREIFKPWET